jgi:acylphosphatase
MKKRVHLFITGDVVGVGFRTWMRRMAHQFNIAGWVRNADNQTVEAVIEGDPKSVESMIAVSRQGPDVCWVKNLSAKPEQIESPLVGFEIKA